MSVCLRECIDTPKLETCWEKQTEETAIFYFFPLFNFLICGLNKWYLQIWYFFTNGFQLVKRINFMSLNYDDRFSLECIDEHNRLLHFFTELLQVIYVHSFVAHYKRFEPTIIVHIKKHTSRTTYGEYMY